MQRQLLREPVGLARLPGVLMPVGPIVPLHERRVDRRTDRRTIQERVQQHQCPEDQGPHHLDDPPLLPPLPHGRVAQILRQDLHGLGRAGRDPDAAAARCRRRRGWPSRRGRVRRWSGAGRSGPRFGRGPAGGVVRTPLRPVCPAPGRARAGARDPPPYGPRRRRGTGPADRRTTPSDKRSPTSHRAGPHGSRGEKATCSWWSGSAWAPAMVR